MSGDVAIGASLSWRDPRLSGLYDCRFARTQVWMPDFVLQNSSNLRNARRNMRNQVVIGPKGKLQYDQRFFGTVSTYHNMWDFPFDTHGFAIGFLAVGTGADLLRLVPDQRGTWISGRLNISGWHVTGFSLAKERTKLRQEGRALSLLTLTIKAAREVNYYLFRVMLPLFFVVAMLWVIIWVPPSRFEFQIGLGANSMLTVIAFNLAEALALPPLGYLTVPGKDPDMVDRRRISRHRRGAHERAERGERA